MQVASFVVGGLAIVISAVSLVVAFVSHRHRVRHDERIRELEEDRHREERRPRILTAGMRDPGAPDDLYLVVTHAGGESCDVSIELLGPPLGLRRIESVRIDRADVRKGDLGRMMPGSRRRLSASENYDGELVETVLITCRADGVPWELVVEAQVQSPPRSGVVRGV